MGKKEGGSIAISQGLAHEVGFWQSAVFPREAQLVPRSLPESFASMCGALGCVSKRLKKCMRAFMRVCARDGGVRWNDSLVAARSSSPPHSRSRGVVVMLRAV
mgnify:CR=1 FL=1